MTGLQRGVEDVREHWRQLVGAVLQGGWRDRVWAGCFAGVLTLKEPVDVPLLQAERRHCGGVGGGHRGLKVWRSCRAGGGGVSGMRLGEGSSSSRYIYFGPSKHSTYGQQRKKIKNNNGRKGLG